MAGISFDFRNIVASEKCAVSSPRIVSLEIGDESPGIASESAFQGIFLNAHVGRNHAKNSNLIRGCDKKSDENFFIHSQSTSTYDDRPSDKIKSANDSDIDLDLLDLLNSANLERASESCAGNFNSEKTASYDKMRIISNGEVCGGLSDLLSSIANDISVKEVDGSTLDYCQSKNARDCGIGLLDFEIVKNECADSLPSNNSSLKAEGNLSDLLSSINIEDSDVTKNGSSNSRNMCNSKAAKKSKLENEPPVTDLSDLLSSFDLGDFNDNKVNSCDLGNMKVLLTKNESCLADILSSVDIDNSNKPDSAVLNSNYSCNRDNMHKMKDLQTNESCLADVLSSIDIDKTNKPALAVLNSEPLSLGISDVHLKDTNGLSDSFNDFTFDVGSSSSSSNSCASSYSEKEHNSPKDSSTKNNAITDKVFESDSGYSSYDSADKGFSFFDYSSDNQFSFNTLLTNKSGASIAMKHSDSEDARTTNEEMSMSDLLTIVSPEFKNPVLADLNKAEKCKGSMNKECSNMQDLIECLNNNDSHVVSNNSVDCNDKQRTYDCVDGRISKNVQVAMETVNVLSEKDDALICRSDFTNDDKVFNDDEQITFIDLRECIKSAERQFTHTSPIKQYSKVEDQSSKCFSPNKILFYCDNKSFSDSSQNKSNPFEFNDVVPRNKSRVNTKQTLFSKALACKPKKDHSLLQKVANIKNELLNNIIHRPVFIDCDLPQPILESVLQSDKCILSNGGRRYFGINPPCELQ